MRGWSGRGQLGEASQAPLLGALRQALNENPLYTAPAKDLPLFRPQQRPCSVLLLQTEPDCRKFGEGCNACSVTECSGCEVGYYLGWVTCETGMKATFKRKECISCSFEFGSNCLECDAFQCTKVRPSFLLQLQHS